MRADPKSQPKEGQKEKEIGANTWTSIRKIEKLWEKME
jgi:hypothetical protein